MEARLLPFIRLSLENKWAVRENLHFHFHWRRGLNRAGFALQNFHRVSRVGHPPPWLAEVKRVWLKEERVKKIPFNGKTAYVSCVFVILICELHPLPCADAGLVHTLIFPWAVLTKLCRGEILRLSFLETRGTFPFPLSLSALPPPTPSSSCSFLVSVSLRVSHLSFPFFIPSLSPLFLFLFHTFLFLFLAPSLI